MKKIEINIYNITEFLRETISKAGIAFNEYGYPIFQRDVILTECPKYIYPFSNRNASPEKKDTVLATFMNDLPLYRRVANLLNDLSVYREYMGAIGFDLTPAVNWDIHYQEMNLLLDQLATAYLTVNGIKITPNFRIGNLQTIHVLDSYPNNIPFAVGMLSCNRHRPTTLDMNYFKTKLLYKMPSMLYLYGHIPNEMISVLQELNIPYKKFIDFKTFSYKQSNLKKRRSS